MVDINVEVDEEKNIIFVKGEEVKKKKKVIRIEKAEEVNLEAEGVKLEL